MRRLWVPLAVPVLALFVACGGGNTVAPMQAPAEIASREIGPSGGLIVLPDGASISIPSGALAREVDIRIEVDSSAPPLDDGTPTGVTYLLGPEGQQFDVPVTVTLPFDPNQIPSGESASDVVVFTAPRESSDYQPMTTKLVDSLHVSVETSHFSHFKAAIPAHKPKLSSGDMTRINVGFSGNAVQFAYYDDFFGASSAVTPNPGPRLCHWYLPWTIACADSGCGTEKPKEVSTEGCSESPGGTPTLNDVACWMQKAEGVCDEALISFKGEWHKGERPHDPPKLDDYENGIKAFLAEPWSTYFSGSLAFTAWNEPDNGGAAGDGLGQAIEPERAAEYYLIAEGQCQTHGCKVAAGDLASNGDFPKDYDWNCDNGSGITSKHECKKRSPYNTSKTPSRASYLDRYKNYIREHWNKKWNTKHPRYVAFHGWHDINVFLANGAMNGTLCGDYADCVTRRLAEGMSGSFWQGVEMWDTEVGVGQGAIKEKNGDTEPYSLDKQACGVAFLLHMTAIDERITRLYYMRLYESPSTFPQALLTTADVKDGNKNPLALDVLASRDPAKAGHCWKGEPKAAPGGNSQSSDAGSSSDGSTVLDTCCAVCDGQTKAYYAAQTPGPDGGLVSCAQAAASFCAFSFGGAGVSTSQIGSCSVYE
jgi:hypothetical protein